MKNNTIDEKATIRLALTVLEELKSYKLLFVQNEFNQVIGTITDGDIRRALIRGISTQDQVSNIMNRDFQYLNSHRFTIDQVDAIREAGITIIPVLDQDRQLARVLNLKVKKSILPMDVVIMAGGRGTRLMPLTEHKPKPLLVVGDKAIIEHSVDRLITFGVNNIYISINHLGDQIVKYFTDNAKEANIQYVREDRPLGTLGSITLVDNFDHDHILLMNSDLLTNIDFEEMLKETIKEDADVMIASIPFEVNVPYAVLHHIDERNLSKLVEKPTYTYQCNAGIYIIHKRNLARIPKEQVFNATDLIDMLIEEGKKVLLYQFLDYWLDIGTPNDYRKAQHDILHLDL